MLLTILSAALKDEREAEPTLFLGSGDGCDGAGEFQRVGPHRQPCWKKFVKVSVLIACGLLLPAPLAIDWWPGHDKVQAAQLMNGGATNLLGAGVLYADAGYDAEWVHAQAQEDWGVATAIKPVKRRKDGTLGGFYRSQMADDWLKRIGYSDRWHVESFFSAMKRTMGSMLSGRSERALFTEAMLKVLTYAIQR